MLGASGVLNIYSRLSSDYYIADIALEYLNDDTLIVLSTQSKHFKDKAYNLLFKRQQHTTYIGKPYKKLTIVPKEIKYLRNINIIHLHYNQIRKIPGCIGQLANLEILGLHCNQIREIPGCIGQLTKLEELYLHYNQIQEIPETIGQLTKLEYLYLYGNQIQTMPDLSHLINCYITK